MSAWGAVDSGSSEAATGDYGFTTDLAGVAGGNFKALLEAWVAVEEISEGILQGAWSGAEDEEKSRGAKKNWRENRG